MQNRRRFSVTLTDDQIANLQDAAAIKTLIAQNIASQIVDRLGIVVDVSLLPRDEEDE